jgi:N-acetyl-gamma-glutamyl-phosphate reductase
MANVAIVGATGYTGAELVRLLALHPKVEELRLYASEGGGERRFEEEFPALRHLHVGAIHPYAPDTLDGLDAVFLALPHGKSAVVAAALEDRVGVIVDLSGDLRLPDHRLWEDWYGQPHPAPELPARAVYGLPELFGEDLPGARLIANPGCYPTAAALALAPALNVPDLCAEDAVVTALSGASGAGRKAATPLLLAELHANAWAYRLGRHQHAPEISRSLERSGGRPVRLTFVPQVIPVERGILVTASLPLCDKAVEQDSLEALYTERYAAHPFVRFLSGRSPSLREVIGTNFCDLTVAADRMGGRLVAVAAIDNLIKGAAGQAVQNWNLAVGWPETTGLLLTA